ncbi:DNA polymerase-3 subunit alpha [Scopulibacillus daqui]|uniref:DNA-directed DNA polymerase n=1 Tax=Scopulibacillus daqui TaxID=1469162 RepID=A0ABS2PXY5_9BACL|nr:DNA polymerase III subunit alpha [Scopulibacillus daqui]MBM7644801.1 DNA polymerase-3 subunit alpha [Scopulibacillus daqui]
MAFIHLHVHSEYSLLDSSCRIKSLVAKAKSQGYKALAITDSNVLYGVIPFYKACQEEGIHPVIGMEVYMENGSGSKLRETAPRDHSLILLAQDQSGYENLVKLSTLLQTSAAKAKRLKRSQLEDYKEGLIVLSSGIKGDVETTLLNGDRQKAYRLAQYYKELFPGRFYLELQDHGMPVEKECQLEILKISKALDIPLAASNDVHYLEKADALAYQCLACIREGESLDGNENKPINDEYYLKSPQEMASLFESYPDAITNTEKIAFQCRVEFSFNQVVLPKFNLPKGWTSKEYLRNQCQKGLKKRYAEINDTIQKRLDDELAVIDQMGFNDYFLIIWDVIRYARETGSMPGPGRGSAAGSLVAYVLEITDVDPLKYHLLFERFLNPERVTMPDIDIDFPDKDRDRMIRYVFEKYGSGHVAQIITFGTLAAKAAIRDVGKALGIDSAKIDRLAKLIPSRPGVTLDQAYQESHQIREHLKQSKELFRLYQLAKAVEGVPRHTSIHAAGVVISEAPLSAKVPLQEGHENIPVTQYTMDVLEDLGLLKMDFLGLRNLSFIETILNLIERETGKSIDINKIPLNDPKTFELLSRGDTTGIFQLESDGMRDVLRQLGPTDFEDIVAVNALYRPGPMKFINVYIDGKHGKRPVAYPHEDLTPILKSTYGVIVYQEQIMQIAAKMAGFTLGEADILRRAVSKKKRHVLEEQRQFFVEGCIERGYSQSTAEDLYQLIVRFADYGFNRSHAVAYSLIAYRLAYLKAHYPVAFMTALLSSVIHHQDKLLDYLFEIKAKGITVYPPSVNKSEAPFINEGLGIRFGLNAIKNLGTGSVQEIIEKRNGRPYKNLVDFCMRISPGKVNRRAIESLIFSGAMDEFGMDRASLIASLDQALKLAEDYQRNRDQATLLEADFDEYAAVEVPPFSLKEKLQFEKEALGVYLTAHPLDDYQKFLSPQTNSVKDAHRQAPHDLLRLAVMIEDAKQIKTKKGQFMAFLSLSDQTGQIDGIVFPKLYRGREELFQKGRMLFIEAKIEKDGNLRKLILQKAKPIEEIRQNKNSKLYLKIDSHQEKTPVLNRVKEMITSHPGSMQVIIYYSTNKKIIQLPESYAVSPSEKLIHSLKQCLGSENVVIKGLK